MNAYLNSYIFINFKMRMVWQKNVHFMLFKKWEESGPFFKNWSCKKKVYLFLLCENLCCVRSRDANFLNRSPPEKYDCLTINCFSRS